MSDHIFICPRAVKYIQTYFSCTNLSSEQWNPDQKNVWIWGGRGEGANPFSGPNRESPIQMRNLLWITLFSLHIRTYFQISPGEISQMHRSGWFLPTQLGRGGNHLPHNQNATPGSVLQNRRFSTCGSQTPDTKNPSSNPNLHEVKPFENRTHEWAEPQHGDDLWRWRRKFHKTQFCSFFNSKFPSSDIPIQPAL